MRRWWPWVLVGVAVAGVVAIALGVRALDVEHWHDRPDGWRR